MIIGGSGRAKEFRREYHNDKQDEVKTIEYITFDLLKKLNTR